MKKNLINIEPNIRYLLKETNNTINEMAIKSGIQRTTLRNILTGQSRISLQSLLSISKAYNKDLDWFVIDHKHT